MIEHRKYYRMENRKLTLLKGIKKPWPWIHYVDTHLAIRQKAWSPYIFDT